MISVVVPVHDEERSVALLYDELDAALQPGGEPWEAVFVDDGSQDGTFAALTRLHAGTPNTKVVRLRRNFGKSAALAAGFATRRGRDRRHDRRRPPGRPERDPAPARKAGRGLRPRLRLEGAPPRPMAPANRVAHLQRGHGPGLRPAAARHELRAQGLSRRGRAGHGALRGAAPLHPRPRALPRLPRRGAVRQPSSAVAWELALRARAVPPRLPRSPDRDVHGALPAPAAAPVRRAGLRPRRRSGRRFSST